VLPPFQDELAAFLEEAAASEEGREQVFDHGLQGPPQRPRCLDIGSAARGRGREAGGGARGRGPVARPGEHVRCPGMSQRGSVLMAAAQVERGGSGSADGEHRPRRPPPDPPSLLLHSRIVYIGMPVRPTAYGCVPCPRVLGKSEGRNSARLPPAGSGSRLVVQGLAVGEALSEKRACWLVLAPGPL